MQLHSKRIAIIGAGPSGLITLKELKEKDLDVTLFEAGSKIGGAFATCYIDATMTSSSVLTAFGCFSDGNEQKPCFWTAVEYIQYLEAFIDRFDLRPHIHLNSKVIAVKRTNPSDPWDVVVTSAANTSKHVFDAVAVCSGAHQTPILPLWATNNSIYQGEILHSTNFHNAVDYFNKKVLVIGMGESGSDITLLISKGASAVTISTRSSPGSLASRFTDPSSKQEPTDLRTCRGLNGSDAWTRKDYDYFWKTAIGCKKGGDVEKVLLQLGYGDRTESFTESELHAFYLNVSNQNYPFNRIGTKNLSFLDSIYDHGAVLKHSGVKTVLKNGVIFDDGSTYICDVIICCTGYTSSFPMLNATLDIHHQDARNRFKKIIDPSIGPALAFIGFARPAFGAIPPMAEMQARYWVDILTGELSLPIDMDMAGEIEFDRQREYKMFQHDFLRVTTLTHYHSYMDRLGDLIGCKPDLKELSRPNNSELFNRVMWSSLSGAQYRLRGPGATNAAWDTVARMPLPRNRQQSSKEVQRVRKLGNKK